MVGIDCSCRQWCGITDVLITPAGSSVVGIDWQWCGRY